MRARRRFSPATYAGIIARQKGLCACGCGEPLGSDPRAFEWDHWVELWEGGKDEPENLCARLKKHHLDKTRRKAGERAKMKRIAERDGLRLPRLNARDKALARMLEEL